MAGASVAVADFEDVVRSTNGWQTELGRGSFGAVYLAQWNGQRAAVKKCDGGWQGQPEALRELLMSAAGKHRHVVDLLAVSYDEGRPWCLVYPFYFKRDLRSLLRQWPDLPASFRVGMGADAAAGLDSLHRRRIIHRDVKSTNVLVDGELRAALSDLAQAVIGEAAALADTRLVYTPGYLDPNVTLAKEYSRGSDVYALGVVHGELLTNELPYDDRAIPPRLVYRLRPKLVAREYHDIAVAGAAFDDEIVEQWGPLVLKCFGGHDHVVARPKAGEVREELGLIQDMQLRYVVDSAGVGQHRLCMKCMSHPAITRFLPMCLGVREIKGTCLLCRSLIHGSELGNFTNDFAMTTISNQGSQYRLQIQQYCLLGGMQCLDTVAQRPLTRTQEDQLGAQALEALWRAEENLDDAQSRIDSGFPLALRYLRFAARDLAVPCLACLHLEPSSGELALRQAALGALHRLGRVAGQARALQASGAGGWRQRRAASGHQWPSEQRLACAELHLCGAAEEWERCCCCSAGGAVARRRAVGKVVGALWQAAAALDEGVSPPAMMVLSTLCARLDAETFSVGIPLQNFDERIAGLALQNAAKLTTLHGGLQPAAFGVAVLELKRRQPYRGWHQRLLDHMETLARCALRWPALEVQLRIARLVREATERCAPAAFPRGAILLLDNLHLALQVSLWEWRFGEPWGRQPGRGFRARDVVVHARDVDFWSAAFAEGGFPARRVRPFGGQLGVAVRRTFVEVPLVQEEEERAAWPRGASARSVSWPPTGAQS